MGIIPTKFKPRDKPRMTIPPHQTSIGKWLLAQCAKKIDPKTGKSITIRQASIQAGFDDPASIWRYTVKGQIPDNESCYKLAEFFGADPYEVLLLAGHLRAPISKEERYKLADAELKRRASRLYDLFDEFVLVADDKMIEALATILRRLMGRS